MSLFDLLFRRGKNPAFELPTDDAWIEQPSGLRIHHVKEGTGAAPSPSSEVTVHYAGWLLTGKLFDSSYKRGKPITFRLDRVVKGWGEGLTLMKEGGVAKLWLPPDLAYGARGAPPAIGPNETLLFQVELISTPS